MLAPDGSTSRVASRLSLKRERSARMKWPRENGAAGPLDEEVIVLDDRASAAILLLEREIRAVADAMEAAGLAGDDLFHNRVAAGAVPDFAQALFACVADLHRFVAAEIRADVNAARRHERAEMRHRAFVVALRLHELAIRQHFMQRIRRHDAEVVVDEVGQPRDLPLGDVSDALGLADQE